MFWMTDGYVDGSLGNGTSDRNEPFGLLRLVSRRLACSRQTNFALASSPLSAGRCSQVEDSGIGNRASNEIECVSPLTYSMSMLGADSPMRRTCSEVHTPASGTVPKAPSRQVLCSFLQASQAGAAVGVML